MEKGAFNPSRCEIKSAELIPFGTRGKKSQDISVMIADFGMSQSIGLSALNGFVSVYDGVGLLQQMPLRGEEQLKLIVYCYDLQTEIYLDCQVYKIDDIEVRDQLKGASYTLHWVTKTTYEASKKSIIKGFSRKKASTIVKDLFTEYFDKRLKKGVPSEGEKLPDNTEVYYLQNEKMSDDARKLYVEKTDNLMSLTIPDYTPAEAMKFIARQTIGKSKSQGSLYRFFETVKGYYFVSDEWLYEYGRRNRVKEFEYGSFTDLSGDAHEQQIKSFTAFGNTQRVDVGAELNNGSYYNSVVEIDILRRTAKRYDYGYKDYAKAFSDSTGKPVDLSTDKHSKEFIESTFTPANAKQFMLIRDYRTEKESYVGPLKQEYYRPDTNYRDLIAKRSFYAAHSSSTAVSASTSGRLDVQAGEVINVKIIDTDITDKVEMNKQQSGRYLVHSIDNSVIDGSLTTSFSLVKYDWSDTGSDLRKETK